MSRKEKEITLLGEKFSEASPLRAVVITLSDRASEGEYEDKSGPCLRTHLEGFLDALGIAYTIESLLLSDDADTLENALIKSRDDGTQLIFTTGGTGIGPRDNTPDVVVKLADKVIPGIMEAIRMKFAVNKPCAILSRTVAAVLGSTLVFTLPGSTKGVTEYMGEIEAILPHSLCVLHGLDVH